MRTNNENLTHFVLAVEVVLARKLLQMSSINRKGQILCKLGGNHHFDLNQLLERAKEYKLHLHFLVTDFEEALEIYKTIGLVSSY